jgi:hypothetical protein
MIRNAFCKLHFSAVLFSLERMQIQFYVSEKVLNGFVSCAYCLNSEFNNKEDVQFHFDYDCKYICVSNTCNCQKCNPYSYLRISNYHTVYVNQNNASIYFTQGPRQFWGINEPYFLVTIDGTLYWITPSGVTPG